MFRALARFRRLPDGLRTRSLSISASLIDKPTDQETATASQSAAQTTDDAVPPSSRLPAGGQTTSQTAEVAPAASSARKRPPTDQTHGRSPWRRTWEGQADEARGRGAEAGSSAQQGLTSSTATPLQPRHRRARRTDPRSAGGAMPGADTANATASNDIATTQRSSKVYPHHEGVVNSSWRPEHLRPRRRVYPPQHSATGGRPVSPAAQKSQSWPGADAAGPAGLPAQPQTAEGSHTGPARTGSQRRAGPHITYAVKAERDGDLGLIAERLKARRPGWFCTVPGCWTLVDLPRVSRCSSVSGAGESPVQHVSTVAIGFAQGLARGTGNSSARVGLAKTLQERYEQLGGHRVGWFYTNRIRMHGRIRDIEACAQLYEEAHSRRVPVDAWFYRAMIFACGQVRSAASHRQLKVSTLTCTPGV